LALRYLARADLPLMVVTARLGYSETPVLTRVCRRWFGETPSELRRKLISSHPAN
jgi:AraC-like DNA-binding protein